MNEFTDNTTTHQISQKEALKIIKIGHLADSHLRLEQYGSKVRGKAFLTSLINAVKTLEEESVAAIICPGDLLDKPNPGSEVCIHDLLVLDAALRKSQLTMYVSRGNHDLVSPHWCDIFQHKSKDGHLYAGNLPIAAITPGIYMCQDGEVIDVRGVEVVMYDYCDGAEFIAKLQQLKEEGKSYPMIAWHGELQEVAKFPLSDSITLRDVPEGITDVLALGHLHVYSLVEAKNKGTAGGSLVAVYPGSTELCSVGEPTQKYVAVHHFGVESERVYSCQVEPVEIKTASVVSFSVKDEDSLQKACDGLAKLSEGIAFIEYDPLVPGCVKRLKRAVKDSRLVLRLTVESKDKLEVQTMDGASLKHGPATFFTANSKKFIPDSMQQQRIQGIIINLLTPETDTKTILGEYITNTLDEVIL